MFVLKKGGALRVSLLLKRSVVACTTQIISGSKRRNIGNLPKPQKTPSSSRSFSNWPPFVRRWRMKSTIGGQADSRNNGPALMQLPSAHRKRRRNGVPLSNVTVPETVIKDAIARGCSPPKQ